MEEADFEKLKYLYFHRMYSIEELEEYFEHKYTYREIREIIMKIIRHKRFTNY